MNATIDDSGFLHILRGGAQDVSEPAFCPYHDERNCGQWCPHFFEHVTDFANKEGLDRKLAVHLGCGGSFWLFSITKDERGERTEDE